MAQVLFNPTDEELRTQYAGIDVVIAPFGQDGYKMRVDDQKARHVLNVLGPRGLTSLEYGDEGDIEKQKAEDGRRRAVEFKKTQVRRYNRDNEARRMKNIEYVDPPEQIRRWAAELGIKLLAPYDIVDVESTQLAALTEEKNVLLKLVEEQRTQLAEISSMLIQKGLMDSPEQKREVVIDDMQAEYKNLNKREFTDWVEKLGFDKFSRYPLAIQQDILTNWEGHHNIDEMPFPY